MASVVAFDARSRELSETEALDWLRLQPRGHAPANSAVLADRWGWSRQRVARCLRTWQATGLITRTGKMLTVTVRDDVVAARAAPPVALAAPSAASTVEPPALPKVDLPATAVVALPAAVALPPAAPIAAPPDEPAVTPAGSRVIALIVGATALALAAVGLVLNAHFAASLGQTGLAAVLLAAIGLAMDVLAVTLPTAASKLWQTRHQLAALAAWLIWAGALVMMLLAGIGFASTNIGDAVAGRAKVANESVALNARLERLREELAAVAEHRSVAVLEAELQRVQPSAQAVWKATNGCRDVTLARSGQACDAVLRAREAIGSAQRRDAIDDEMRGVEHQLALLPAIRLDDPQARMTSDLVAWLSGGLIAPTVHDIHRLRVVGLTLAPAFAGLLLWMAVALWRRRA
jgi:hypothetical protein